MGQQTGTIGVAWKYMFQFSERPRTKTYGSSWAVSGIGRWEKRFRTFRSLACAQHAHEPQHNRVPSSRAGTRKQRNNPPAPSIIPLSLRC